MIGRVAPVLFEVGKLERRHRCGRRSFGFRSNGDIAATPGLVCSGRVTWPINVAANVGNAGSSQMTALCYMMAFERKWFLTMVLTMEPMKYKSTATLSCFAALLLAAGAIQNLNAFTYVDGDLLLVFRRDQFSDAEFNLGTVSNYLGLANGTVRTITNFDVSTVLANFNNNLNGVTIALVAATTTQDAQRRAWVTDSDSSTARQGISGSKFSTIWSKVNGVGVRAAQVTMFSASQTFVVSPSDPSSYTYIASTGGANDVATLSGTVPFSIENTIPANSIRFFQLPVPATLPGVQIGTFSITANGTLTFTAGSGSTVPTITSQPTNVTVFAGGPAAFSVGASGATGYQWQFNDNPIGGATASSYSLNAHSSDAGNYRVVVSNAGGSVTSAVASLTVNLPAAASLGQVGKAPGGAFSLTLSGTASAYYEIQSNTNLSTSNWITIAFITNSGGMTAFSDFAATNSNQRFYRAIAR